jgi:hypothetical protein
MNEDLVCLRGMLIFFKKKLNLFFKFKLFFYFLDCFDVIILKINFKKYYFNIITETANEWSSRGTVQKNAMFYTQEKTKETKTIWHRMADVICSIGTQLCKWYPPQQMA